MNRPEVPQVDSAQTLSGLLHQLTSQLSTLLRQELTLARTELFQALTRLLSSIGAILAGIAFLYAALMLLIITAVLGLALLMPLWLATLVLGATTLLIGFILVQRGRRALKNAHLAPSHSPHSLKKDKDVLLRRTEP